MPGIAWWLSGGVRRCIFERCREDALVALILKVVGYNSYNVKRKIFFFVKICVGSGIMCIVNQIFREVKNVWEFIKHNDNDSCE